MCIRLIFALLLTTCLLGTWGCATHQQDEDKPRDMTTRQPTPPPAPPVGRTNSQ